MSSSQSAKGQNIGYLRVSTVDQNTARQLDGVELDRVFVDKCSGGTTNRPALKACLEYLREGDTLYIHSIDRLARNLSDLLSIVAGLAEKGVEVTFHKEKLTFNRENDAMAKFLLHVFGAVAEFEKSMIKERRLEGQAKARREGKHMGRKSNITTAQLEEIKARRANGETLTAIGKAYGVSATTIMNQLKASA